MDSCLRVHNVPKFSQRALSYIQISIQNENLVVLLAVIFSLHKSRIPTTDKHNTTRYSQEQMCANNKPRQINFKEKDAGARESIPACSNVLCDIPVIYKRANYCNHDMKAWNYESLSIASVSCLI